MLEHGQDQGLDWLFLDLNSYFASVEQQENPALRGRPVAVIPSDTDYTCAIAASYEAKIYGIKTGTPILEAKRMCPKLVCVLARHHVYVDYHERIISEIIKHIPINKIWSVDELSSRLPLRFRSEDAVRDLARRIKKGLHDTIGEAIHCSIGVAPSSFLAKVATDMQKPDGLVILKKPELPGPLLQLELMDLPGINVGMRERLRKGGVTTLEELWNTTPKQARHIWGSVAGERFWYNLHGINIPDQQTNTSLIGHSRVLDPQFRSPDAAKSVARRLTVKAATRLRRKNLHAARFAFSARIHHHDIKHGIKWANDMSVSPAQDNFTFLEALQTLWDQMSHDTKPQRIKKISVTLYGLKRAEHITGDLFDHASTDRKHIIQKNETLSAAMDRLNQRYGAETVQLGPSPKTESGYLGTKIAFSRIPDMAEFNE